MKFQSFDGFKYMRDRLKTPLRIIVRSSDSDPIYDSVGNLVKPDPKVYEVEETLQLATSNSAANFGTIYPATDGGTVPMSTVFWISKQFHGLAKGTMVIDLVHSKVYRVIKSTNNPVSGLSYYALENTDDSKGSDEDLLPNN